MGSKWRCLTNLFIEEDHMTVFVKRLDLGGSGPAVGIKDTIDIAGVPTMAGSKALAQALPARANAAVVAGLLAAGYHIAGKTNLHELAFGTTGINRWTGTPLNCKYPAYVPGGSSSGSAVAVASPAFPRHAAASMVSSRHLAGSAAMASCPRTAAWIASAPWLPICRP